MTVATAPSQSLTERFAFAVELVLRGLSLSLRRRSDAAPVALATWNRLKRLVARFTALVSAVEAGRFATGCRAPVVDRKSRALLPESQVPPQAPAQVVKVPQAYGWLLTLAPELNTRIGRAQIEGLLADPALLALLGQVPQAGRILRPLCHMLRIALPPCLRLPTRPRRPRSLAGAADSEPASAARPKRPKPSWLRWPKSPPLPRMVLAAGSPPPGCFGTGPPND